MKADNEFRCYVLLPTAAVMASWTCSGKAAATLAAFGAIGAAILWSKSWFRPVLVIQFVHLVGLVGAVRLAVGCMQSEINGPSSILDNHCANSAALDVSADGTKVAIAALDSISGERAFNHPSVHVWDAARRSLTKAILDVDATKLRFSPTGDRLATYSTHREAWYYRQEYKIDLWDTASWQNLSTTNFVQDNVDLAYINDGSILGAFFENAAYYWSCADGRAIDRIASDGTMECSRNNAVVVLSEDRGRYLASTNLIQCVRIGESKKPALLFSNSRIGTGAPDKITLSPNGRFLAVDSHELFLFDTFDAKLLWSDPSREFATVTIAFNSSDQRIAYATSNWIEVRDVLSGKSLLRDQFPTSDLVWPHIVWSGVRYVASIGKTIRIWDSDHSKLVVDAPLPMRENNEKEYKLTFAENESCVGIADATGFRVFTLPEGLMLWQIPRLVTADSLANQSSWSVGERIMFSPDGKFTFLTDSDVVEILDARSGAIVRRDDFVGFVSEALFSRDSRQIFYIDSSQNTLRTWQLMR